MRIRPPTLMNLLLILAFSYAAISASGWPYATRLFVWAISAPALFCLFVQLVIDLRRKVQPGSPGDLFETADLPVDRSIPTRLVVQRGLNFLAWLLGFFAAIWLIGFKAALPLFMMSYLLFQARESWRLSLVLTLLVVAVQIVIFDRLLQIAWPEGVLVSWFERILG
jgi:hypothetical protein